MTEKLPAEVAGALAFKFLLCELRGGQRVELEPGEGVAEFSRVLDEQGVEGIRALADEFMGPEGAE